MMHFLLLHSIPVCVCLCVCVCVTTYSIYGYLSDLQFGTILKSTVIKKKALLLIFYYWSLNYTYV